SIVAEPEHQLNCNYHRFRLANLYESLAGRINVFLRLRRMLGWEMAELDRYMRLIHGQFVVPETLTVLSQFVRLSKEWKLSRDEALVLLRNLDLRRTERHPRSQFDGFFKKGSPTTPEYAAIERLGKGQLSVEIDEPPISGQPDAPLTSTEGFKTHIRSALGINATEMDALWSLVVTGTELDVAQLSH